MVLAVSQNQPVLVGIKGVKTSHFKERKTAPRDYWEAVPMERVQRPQSELANHDLQFSRSRMVPAAHSEGTWDQSRNGWAVFAVGKTGPFDRRVRRRPASNTGQFDRRQKWPTQESMRAA